MKCSKCGQQLVDGAAFCMFCGAKAGKLCPKCGTELPDVAMFCYKCGANLNAPTKLDTKPTQNHTLDDNTMKSLQQAKPKDDYKLKGDPVWEINSSGNRCDCAVGECDCDGSIWS